ncbi:hypothetical protein PC128_g22921 [Phytophthora cactorum]|nr:hypothetical protein PC128_g22921 [Phytophthora cactorum]
MKPVPAPELVRDYHRWMSGVDVLDQLRMQRYSVQLYYKSRKYYRKLFLGLLDMAFVNALIVFRHQQKVKNKRPAKHFSFIETLMEQLPAIDSSETYNAIESATSAQDRTAASPARAETTEELAQPEEAVMDYWHRLEEKPDTVDNEQGPTRRHRSCKVCVT